MDKITKLLFERQDKEYGAFTRKLTPGLDEDNMIGVRFPDLKAIYKTLDETEKAEFMKKLPHKYFEENNLHAFLIERMRYYGAVIAALDAFLPYVNNWATCDSLSPKCFRKHHAELRREIDRWLASPHIYVVRFAIKTLMNEFLGDDFLPDDPERLAAFQTDEYYLQMMIAWYFATALAKRFDDILPYFRTGALDPTIRKMAVRKAKDSFRITKEQKELLNRI